MERLSRNVTSRETNIHQALQHLKASEDAFEGALGSQVHEKSAAISSEVAQLGSDVDRVKAEMRVCAQT